MTYFLEGFLIIWSLKALGFVAGLLCMGMAGLVVILIIEHWRAGGWKKG